MATPLQIDEMVNLTEEALKRTLEQMPKIWKVQYDYCFEDMTVRVGKITQAFSKLYNSNREPSYIYVEAKDELGAYVKALRILEEQNKCT